MRVVAGIVLGGIAAAIGASLMMRYLNAILAMGIGGTQGWAAGYGYLAPVAGLVTFTLVFGAVFGAVTERR